MSDKPKISIILPCYNSGQLLSGCLDSIIAQTFRDFELIAIDDGSSDGTPELLKAYAARDKRIRVISQENAGEACARNRGLDEASGECIYFTDHDDTLHPQALEILYRFLHDFSLDGVSCGFVKCNRPALDLKADMVPAEIGFKIVDEPLCQALRHRGLITIAPWGKLYRRSLIGDTRFPPHCHFDDISFHFCMLAKLDKIGLIDAVLYHFYQNPLSVSHTEINSQKVWSYITGIRDMDAFFKQPEYVRFYPSMQQKVFPAFVNVVLGGVWKLRKKNPAAYAEMRAQLHGYLRDLFRDKIIRLRDFKLRKQWRIIRLLLKV